jgi:pyridoxine 5-phosphate synthase
MGDLGVNIDHVATIRQARKTIEPDPVYAAFIAETAGADGITVHLRSDRRHIQDRDVELLMRTVRTKLNLEMSLAPDILDLTCKFKPHNCCIVPENRQEVTTEGGLDVAGQLERVQSAATRLKAAGIVVSLFINPDPIQIKAAATSGAPFIELHTGEYANAKTEVFRQAELKKLVSAATLAKELGLRVNAGHGLTYHNVQPVAAIKEIEELNIGHSIISRAVITGLTEAVREMKRLIVEARIKIV